MLPSTQLHAQLASALAFVAIDASNARVDNIASLFIASPLRPSQHPVPLAN
jgi:hypothetical protein